jgi:3-deoxy-D-manno-octulosonate 8-phosphate phosphatase (KDO 8-P phosphatase)
LLSAFAQINTFVFDVDGVLTDSTLLLLPGGEMARSMNIKDGYALQLAVKQGYQVFIISGGKSDLVKDRLEKLGVSKVFMGVADKKALLLELLEKSNLFAHNTLFMGDDMPDLEAMQSVGLPCCPADACSEVKAISRYISPITGGFGCARDVIEKVMKLQGKWHAVEGATSR